MDETVDEKHLFMMCRELNARALSTMPAGFQLRLCRRDELDLWMAMPFDEPEEAKRYRPFMEEFFHNVYGAAEDLFFERCMFACGQGDRPVGTCFVWPSYGKINTIHWLKVRKAYEGRGIGRALLSAALGDLSGADFPVYLHTHPPCTRAIKLYLDFGFRFLSDPWIGRRQNGWQSSLAVLKAALPTATHQILKAENAPQAFLALVAASAAEEF